MVETTIGTAVARGKGSLTLTRLRHGRAWIFRWRGVLRELVRTNDIVLVSAIGALLDGAKIDHLVLDQNMSVIEGSLGILPRRILVHDEDNRAARQLLTDAGLSHELRPDE
jgi:Putative prokaryotic signal transducing protein